MDKSLCPIANGTLCSKNMSAWYDDEMGRCCIQTVAHALDSLSLLADGVWEETVDDD